MEHILRPHPVPRAVRCPNSLVVVVVGIMSTFKPAAFPYFRVRKGACSNRRSNARTNLAIPMTATSASWKKRKVQNQK